jgi:hypothetical protein
MATRTDIEIHELTPEQGRQLLDDKARRYLGISGNEFRSRWEAGEIDADDEPDMMRARCSWPLGFSFQCARLSGIRDAMSSHDALSLDASRPSLERWDVSAACVQRKIKPLPGDRSAVVGEERKGVGASWVD